MATESKSLKKKKFWKSGTMDVLSFIVMGPMLLVIFAVLVNIIQLGRFREQLEYATYAAGRAAVVSTNREAAQHNAEVVARVNMADFIDDIDGGEDGITVSLQAVDYDNFALTSADEYAAWQKGNYIQCEVSAMYHSVVSVLGSGERSCSMIMAIEYNDGDAAHDLGNDDDNTEDTADDNADDISNGNASEDTADSGSDNAADNSADAETDAG